MLTSAVVRTANHCFVRTDAPSGRARFNRSTAPGAGSDAQSAKPTTCQVVPMGARRTWNEPEGAVTATERAHSRASLLYWATRSCEVGPGGSLDTAPTVMSPVERHNPPAAAGCEPNSGLAACCDSALA